MEGGTQLGRGGREECGAGLDACGAGAGEVALSGADCARAVDCSTGLGGHGCVVDANVLENHSHTFRYLCFIKYLIKRWCEFCCAKSLN